MIFAPPSRDYPGAQGLISKPRTIKDDPVPGKRCESSLKYVKRLMPFVRPNSEGIPYHSFCAFATQKVGEGAIKMSFVQVSKSSRDPSIPFSILDLKAQAVRLPVSKGSQILLSELLTWSGERGYCWWGTPSIAKDLNWSVSAVWRRATELKQAGLLEVIPRPGRSNYWVPLPGKTKMERLRFELAPLAESRGPSYEKKTEKSIKRCTVKKLCASTDQAPPPPSNVNAIKICPEEMAPLSGTNPPETLESIQEPVPVIQIPPVLGPIRQKATPPVVVSKPNIKASITAEQIFLVEEIERVTGDTWSRGHFLNLVRQVDEQTIYGGLSVTREKMAMESGVNGGAYFTSTIRGMTELASLGAKPVADAMTPPSPPAHPSAPLPAPPTRRFLISDEPEPVPFDPESLKRGWRLHYRGAGIRGMITLVQRCVPLSVDVGRLWGDVRETFPGMEESILIDRLLDTVVTRMKHAERMAEG